MSQEAELNMERCAEFMARMIQKYGKKILDDIMAGRPAFMEMLDDISSEKDDI